MGDRPQVELIAALQSLYHAREYTDYAIITRDGIRHEVHRAIICPRSRFFAEAVKSKHPTEISLPEDNHEIVHLMIEYFYLLDYTPQTLSATSVSHRHSSISSDAQSVRTEAATYGNVYGTSAISAFGGPSHHRSSTEPQHYGSLFGTGHDRSASLLTVHALPGQDISTFGGPATPHRRGTPSRLQRAPSASPLATREPNLSLHAMVYAAGEKYGISGMKALALDKFKIQLTKHWDSPELAEAIHVVYNATPSSDKDMRDAVADALGWHGRLLDKPEIEVAIMEINGLAYDLLKRMRRAEPEYE